MSERRLFGWLTSLFRPFPPIRRVGGLMMGQPKVLLIGDQKVGKSSLLRQLGKKETQPLRTWEPRASGSTVQIAHKEDRTATYIEEATLTDPFPLLSLQTADVVVLCFSLVDRLTWQAVLKGLDTVHKEDAKTKVYHPVIVVGLKADLRDAHVTALKQQAKQQQQQQQQASDQDAGPLLTPSEHAQWNASALPVDVLLRVFSFLPTRDLVSASYVCRQWAQVARHPYNWHARARGHLTAKQARDHLRSGQLAKWPIQYFELTVKDDPKASRSAQQQATDQVKQFLYQTVVAVASNTRTLPPAVVKQIDDDAAVAASNAASSSSSSASAASTQAVEPSPSAGPSVEPS